LVSGALHPPPGRLRNPDIYASVICVAEELDDILVAIPALT
jgi:hypothetical protein